MGGYHEETKAEAEAIRTISREKWYSKISKEFTVGAYMIRYTSGGSNRLDNTIFKSLYAISTRISQSRFPAAAFLCLAKNKPALRVLYGS